MYNLPERVILASNFDEDESTQQKADANLYHLQLWITYTLSASDRNVAIFF
jgi:hypothetical protein